MGGYEAIVTPLIAGLGIPPPPAPLTANPAGPAGQAAAIGQAAANGAASAAMSQSLSGVQQASGAVQSGAAAAGELRAVDGLDGPADAEPLGQLPQMLGTISSDARTVPADAWPVPTDGDGHARTAASGMGGANGVNGLEKAGRGSGAGGDHRCRCAWGGGGAGGIGGATGVMSSFTRPTGSFNAPGPPKLPSGWAPGAAGAGSGDVRAPTGAGGSGGLYGAPPPHMGRDDRGRDGSAEGRTMQLTVGPRTGREDWPEIDAETTSRSGIGSSIGQTE